MENYVWAGFVQDHIGEPCGQAFPETETIFKTSVDTYAQSNSLLAKSTRNASVPVGSIVPFAGPYLTNDEIQRYATSSQSTRLDIIRNKLGLTIESWMLCDGRPLSAEAYPQLFQSIGYSWGRLDDGRFRLPDLRGVFVRGTDYGANMDPEAEQRVSKNGGNSGAHVGSFQEHALKNHTHTGTHHPNSGRGVNATSSNERSISNSTANHTTTGVSISESSRFETRPRNLSVNYLIKVK